MEKRKRYYRNVSKMLKDGGLFIVTSCNWTEEELKSHFEPGNLHILWRCQVNALKLYFDNFLQVFLNKYKKKLKKFKLINTVFSEGFIFLDKIPAPTFQFGGNIGSRETSLVFKRNTEGQSWHGVK